MISVLKSPTQKTIMAPRPKKVKFEVSKKKLGIIQADEEIYSTNELIMYFYF